MQISFVLQIWITAQWQSMQDTKGQGFLPYLKNIDLTTIREIDIYKLGSRHLFY